MERVELKYSYREMNSPKSICWSVEGVNRPLRPRNEGIMSTGHDALPILTAI